MSNDLVVISLFFGVGCLAGLFLDVFELIMLAVLPSLLVLAAGQLAFGLAMPWYVYLAAWAAQQVAYFLAVIALRPLAARVGVTKPRIMPDR